MKQKLLKNLVESIENWIQRNWESYKDVSNKIETFDKNQSPDFPASNDLVEENYDTNVKWFEKC